MVIAVKAKRITCGKIRGPLKIIVEAAIKEDSNELLGNRPSSKDVAYQILGKLNAYLDEYPECKAKPPVVGTLWSMVGRARSEMDVFRGHKIKGTGDRKAMLPKTAERKKRKLDKAVAKAEKQARAEMATERAEDDTGLSLTGPPVVLGAQFMCMLVGQSKVYPERHDTLVNAEEHARELAKRHKEPVDILERKARVEYKEPTEPVFKTTYAV